MWLILLIILIGLLYWFFTRNLNLWESKNVLHEKPTPFFGNFRSVVFKQDSLPDILNKYYKKFYGAPYFGMYILQNPNLVLTDPEMIKQILVKDFNSFVNRPIYIDEKVEPIGYHIMALAKDKTWKSLRAKLSPVFTSGKLKLMFPLMQDISKNLKMYLEKKSGHVINVYDVIKNYSVDVISSCAFGIEANSIKNENSKIKQMSKKLLDLAKTTRSFAVMSYFFMPFFVKLFKFRLLEKNSTEFLINVFKKAYYERKSLGMKRNDLIDLLHNLKEEEKEDDDYKFDDLKLGAQAVLFFSSGNDTTTTTMSLALYELALNPSVQEKLRDELRENVDKNNHFDYETLLDMPYLDMVVQETLRKYPLSPAMNREANEDYTFEKTGLKIEKGTAVLIPVCSLRSDPKYFPNPEKFDPERFSSPERKKAFQSVYFPFGEGPRRCIGDRFAVLSIKTGLSTIIKDFKISKTEKTDVPLKIIKTSPFLEPENYTIPLKFEKI